MAGPRKGWLAHEKKAQPRKEAGRGDGPARETDRLLAGVAAAGGDAAHAAFVAGPAEDVAAWGNPVTPLAQARGNSGGFAVTAAAHQAEVGQYARGGDATIVGQGQQRSAELVVRLRAIVGRAGQEGAQGGQDLEHVA